MRSKVSIALTCWWLIPLLAALLPATDIPTATAPLPPPPPVKLAILKLIPNPGDQEGNFAKLDRSAREAAAAGAGILVTSECYLDGYLGHSRMHPGMTVERLLQASEPLEGPYVQRAAALARELSVWLVFGFSERRGGQVFNTAALIDPAGRIAGTYSKSHIGRPYELYEAGSTFPVFDTPFGRLGLLICFDRQVPETSRLLALRGAGLIIIPAHSPNVDLINEDLMMRVRAYENNTYVVLANPFNSLVVEPGGDIIAHHPSRSEEGIVYAWIDFSRRDADRDSITGRRPGIYGDLVRPE
jgi:predicted amidohydrolase